MFTATAHSRPLILLLRGSSLSTSATVVNCLTSQPLAVITSPPESIPLDDSLLQHHNGDMYVYLRTDRGKKLCIAGLKTPTF